MTLPADGERFLPDQKGQIELEHLHRYAMARELVRGKVVLDIACGEGYGSALLSMVAGSVVGVDISENVIQHAQETYSNANLRFFTGSCSNIPVEDGTIDVVVSFETIEHHSEHEEMMAEIKRVLRPKGVLIISSPDRYEYSVVPGYTNPYHVKELTREEFESLRAVSGSDPSPTRPVLSHRYGSHRSREWGLLLNLDAACLAFVFVRWGSTRAIVFASGSRLM